jgi:hypothetical protein
MLEDAVIQELHESREAHAKSFNYDVKAIVADLKVKEAALAHRLVQRPIKRRQEVRSSCELGVKEILHAL